MKQLYLKCIILAILSLINITASAYDCSVSGIYYNLDNTNNTASVTFRNSFYNSYRGIKTIPSTITRRGITYSVTSIGDDAFRECTNLTSVTIPNSVTSIGKDTFSGCGLTSVTIPSSVTSIGEYVFAGCSDLTSITIPSSVTSIGKGTFYDCSGLTSIDIPSSVTSIGDYAFNQCTGLTSVTIPNSVTSIGDYAFYYCTGLTSIEIPSSVTSIGLSAFYGCSALIKVKIFDITSWCNISFSDNPLCYAHNLYINNELVSDLIIPSSVTSIGNHAFWGCSGLKSVEIPNSVVSIGELAFGECSGLKSVEIPNSVVSIGLLAFAGCSGLTSVTIPNSVTSIGDDAFWNWSDMKSLKSVTSYITDVFKTGKGAFSGNPTDATLYVPKGLVDTYKATEDWNRFSNIVEMSDSKLGDVNNDGSTDISDVVSLVNGILSSSETDDSYDVNGDGNVDISDVVALVNMILGQ